jgi:hypothetical protein
MVRFVLQGFFYALSHCVLALWYETAVEKQKAPKFGATLQILQ